MSLDEDATPTIDEMREDYAVRWAAGRDPYPYQSDIVKGREIFDRFLREVQRTTWDEGHRAGAVYFPEDRRTEWPTNPYRETT